MPQQAQGSHLGCSMCYQGGPRLLPPRTSMLTDAAPRKYLLPTQQPGRDSNLHAFFFFLPSFAVTGLQRRCRLGGCRAWHYISPVPLRLLLPCLTTRNLPHLICPHLLPKPQPEGTRCWEAAQRQQPPSAALRATRTPHERLPFWHRSSKRRSECPELLTALWKSSLQAKSGQFAALQAQPT